MSKKPMMLLKKSTLILAIIAVSGCASVTSDYCLITKPIQLSDAAIDAMTDLDVYQVDLHNETYYALCEP